MLLSVLICSIESRDKMLSDLLAYLDKQGGGFIGLTTKYQLGCRMGVLTYQEHEIIFAVDAQEISTGNKRQLLLETAIGEGVVYIDEDDEVPDYYLSEMIKSVKSGCDCAAIRGKITTDGGNEMQWFLAKDNPNETVNLSGVPVYIRKTNHITMVRRNIALLGGFENKSNAEDKAYSEAINQYLKTEYVIDKPMYHYKFISTNKSYT